MSLADTKKMLLNAQNGKYAVPAFNFENMEMALAIVRTCEEMRSPVILQTTTSTIKFAGVSMYAAIGRAAAEAVDVPVALHLDHGASPKICHDALMAGYSSVMIDGSQLPLDENITVSRDVVSEAHEKGIPVEAELGRVGGKEDDLDGGDGGYTSPSVALEFVKGTGVDSLAVAIGTAHGVYKTTPKLDVERLKQIREALICGECDIPLVLHGASGLSENAVRDCIKEGICKVNFATELRQAYTAGVRKALSCDLAMYDPKKYAAEGIKELKEAVRARILVCMSDGKA